MFYGFFHGKIQEHELFLRNVDEVARSGVWGRRHKNGADPAVARGNVPGDETHCVAALGRKFSQHYLLERLCLLRRESLHHVLRGAVDAFTERYPSQEGPS